MTNRKLILYDLVPSPPCRAVKVLAKALNIGLELKTISLIAREQFNEDFIKLNPNHTIPTLDDNGIILWDSHAILAYLVDKYAEDDSFYPKDIKQRAFINQLLFMNSTVFQKLFNFILKPLFLNNEKEIGQLTKDSIHDSYTSIERILTSKTYLAGNNVTIADISFIATLTSAELLIPIDGKVFPNITNWKKKMQQLSYYEPNDIGVKQHEFLIKQALEG